ncbi:hypothetical protein Q7300_02875 [Glaesserella parasuis]|uniref:hypothetical protein n=1 Tax=Glaesserella parasuis TaxID=738 RepID=UPI001F2B967C|nr:hypothetical protein [Glaesserella parasuis]MDP0202559.1 hypothetical protein [Glaesserella parasuis]
MKIYYLFDPLCGWCYGASATLQKLNEIYPLTLTPTGLFYQKRSENGRRFCLLCVE